MFYLFKLHCSAAKYVSMTLILTVT